MSPDRWSVRNAALIGFALGAIFYPLRAMLVGDPIPAGTAAALGGSLGAGLGGAMLFSVGAFLHNATRSGSK